MVRIVKQRIIRARTSHTCLGCNDIIERGQHGVLSRVVAYDGDSRLSRQYFCSRCVRNAREGGSQ